VGGPLSKEGHQGEVSSQGAELDSEMTLATVRAHEAIGAALDTLAAKSEVMGGDELGKGLCGVAHGLLTGKAALFFSRLSEIVPAPRP
jgi:hypothetical protein